MPSESYPTKKACRVRAVRSTLNQASDAMLYAKCSSHANLFEIRRAGVRPETVGELHLGAQVRRQWPL